jgi:hypothetical protein
VFPYLALAVGAKNTLDTKG